jgi:hypothetical protein
MFARETVRVRRELAVLPGLAGGFTATAARRDANPTVAVSATSTPGRAGSVNIGGGTNNAA